NEAMGQPIDGETHVHIAKHRNGSNDTVKVQFIKEYQKFDDLPDNDFGFGGNDFPNFGGGGGGFDRGNGGGGNFRPLGDNPQAGIIRNSQPDTSAFGRSKMFILADFQSSPSKPNDYNFDDDVMPSPLKQK